MAPTVYESPYKGRNAIRWMMIHGVAQTLVCKWHQICLTGMQDPARREGIRMGG